VSALLLGSNAISDDGAAAVGRLVAFSDLKHLTLSDNQFGAALGLELGKALATPSVVDQRFPALHFLDLANNQLGDEGAVHLATHLERRMHLERATTPLAGANNSLHYLDLRNNGISNEGARALVERVLCCSPDLGILKLDTDHLNSKLRSRLEYLLTDSAMAYKKAGFNITQMEADDRRRERQFKIDAGEADRLILLRKTSNRHKLREQMPAMLGVSESSSGLVDIHCFPEPDDAVMKRIFSGGSDDIADSEAPNNK
jgi:hypothetical protein